MELPTIEVRAQGLAVEAEVHAGSRATPNIFHSATSIFMVRTSPLVLYCCICIAGKS
jgi:hypothetical protein